MRSGDSEIDDLMKKGVTLMNLRQLEAAIDVFSEMIRKKPGFAEGWNKRATALFMAKRYQESVADCNKTLELNPYHFGALSGLGMNYVELDDLDGALDAFKRTMKLLPHSKNTAQYIEILEKKISEKRKKI
jgi:tetratricopeptide (TPR) repeat protein